MWVVQRVVVPLLQLAVRAFPPLGRAAGRTSGGLAGRVFHHRDLGDHRAAYAVALEALSRYERSKPVLFDVLQDFNWWTFLDLAVREAEHLDEVERTHVVELAEKAQVPGGMFAARCLQKFAEWRWHAGEGDAALGFARRAVLADPSWPYGHVFLGWLGLVSGRLDPLPHLREALRLDPSVADTIRKNQPLAGAPGLLKSLGIAAM